MNAPRVMIIGLDCLEPRLVFDRWADDLTHLKHLMDEGLWGDLESVHPPITVPAWTCMMTSRNPGTLGFYGFRNRKDYSYEGMTFATAAAVKHETLWEILGRQGKKVILLGIPQTYPPRPVNGCLVTSFLTPSIESNYTYPPELKDEIQRVLGGRYIIDVENFRTPDRDSVLAQVHEMTEKRFKLARHLLTTKPWDFFMMVEMGPDRMHHAFWHYFDKLHPRYEPGSKLESAMHDYYVALDREVGTLLQLAPEGCSVMVVSDHGAKKMEGGICVNEWLMQEGYLTLKRKPVEPTPFAKVEVDWPRTRAWGEGGYYARLFLNVEGREPSGAVPASDYEKLRAEIKEKLEAMTDEKGRELGTRVYRPQDIYPECNGVPPDLFVYFGNLDWRSVGSLGMGSIYTYENDTGPDEANHSFYGTFIMRPGKGALPAGVRLREVSLMDIAPTVLDLMGLEVPETMEGRVIRAEEAEEPYSEGDEEKIAKRLKDLGYI